MPKQDGNTKIVESFMTSNKQMSLNNKNIYYNEYSDEVLIRYYQTLIAVRKGKSVRILEGINKYSASTNVLVKLIERIAEEKGCTVSYVKQFAKGSTVSSKMLEVGDMVKIMPSYPSQYTNSKGQIVKVMPNGKTYEVKIKHKSGNEYVKFEKSELVFLGYEPKYGNGGGVAVSSESGLAVGTNADLLMNEQYLQYANGSTLNGELNELQKQLLLNETDKVLFLTVEEIYEIQVLLSQMEDKSLSKEESKKLFIKVLDSQLKKEINGKTYYTIGYTARGKGRDYSLRQATEIFNKLHKIGVDAIICQYIPLFNPIVPKSVHDFSFSVLTSPMLSYNSYKELVKGSESVGEQGDPKNNYYAEGGNTLSQYSYSIGGL